jgi:hypothetical protein
VLAEISAELRVAVSLKLHIVRGEFTLCGHRLPECDIHAPGRGWDAWEALLAQRCFTCDTVLASSTASSSQSGHGASDTSRHPPGIAAPNPSTPLSMPR